MPHTKIVCTLGPSVDSPEIIQGLIDAGMNVARINCSHGDKETRTKWVKWIREASPSLGPVGILYDLQGPKFRIGRIEGGLRNFKVGEAIHIKKEGVADLTISHPEVWDGLSVGERILLGDGNVEIVVEEVGIGYAAASVASGGDVRSRQGVTVIDRSFSVPVITPKDRENIEEALECEADFLALSYVRSAADLDELRAIVAGRNPELKLVSKVETREALNCIREVVAASDVVMVARGDLGLQMNFDEVPVAQKTIISACNAAAKPVITATQMLESMISSPRPTRAEASDVANAILDGTDAVMLSGETATGMFPIEAVRTMTAIARTAERLIMYDRRYADKATDDTAGTDAVAHGAVQIAVRLDAKAIVTTSTSGMTPRLVSKYRPHAPVYCTAYRESTARYLSVVWGVQALYAPTPSSTDESISEAVKAFADAGRLEKGTKIVVTAGVPVGTPGNTNLILVRDV